jgi:small subunit ribosomal protein S4
MFVTQEKKERALGVRLGLKPDRCASPKCAMVRKPYRPGLHGKRRQGAASEMKLQLQEKQKVRLSYGLREAAMHRAVHEAMRKKGSNADMLMILLERRLDNVVYRLGFAPSRSVARQLISHGHITVNGRKVTIPSFRMAPGAVVGVRSESRAHPAFKDLAAAFAKTEVPVWLSRDAEALTGTLVSLPKDVEAPFDINLIIDYYSK